MPERWIFFTIGLVVFTTAGVIGWRLRHRDKDRAVFLILVCLIPILGRVVLVMFPQLEYQVFTHDQYALLRPWWSVPFAIALFTVASPHMSSQSARRGLIGLSIVLWAFGTDRLLATARFDPETMDGVVQADGVCRQTTDYTCGAAAAATLLHHYGVTTNEREMAELCWTNSLTGTDELCVARGLRRKLEDTSLTPFITTATYEDLVTWNEPVAVTIKYQLLVDHWVVVIDAREGRVLVGDPMGGRRIFTEEAFRERWRGVMVKLVPRGPEG